MLRQIRQHESISAAARAMGMSYKRAWHLIDQINRGLGQPVVHTTTGGKGGGGARLTAIGEALVDRYMALEDQLNDVAAPHLHAIATLVRTR